MRKTLHRMTLDELTAKNAFRSIYTSQIRPITHEITVSLETNYNGKTYRSLSVRLYSIEDLNTHSMEYSTASECLTIPVPARLTDSNLTKYLPVIIKSCKSRYNELSDQGKAHPLGLCLKQFIDKTH